MEPQGRVASAPLRAGDPTTVGSYEIAGRIGEGGMGTVYLGRAPDGRPVAVKVVRAELAGDKVFLARFRDEVGNAERVASFCTAQVLDHGDVAGRAYMVTEFIEGPSLAEYIRANGALSAGMLHGFAVGVAAALVAIHSAGLVHRDLKPRNVLLSMSGPRVIDFGIARALDVSSQHTRTGQLIGSPGWIAPEQIQSFEVTTAADIFAWGCLIAYAATGRHPFGEGGFPVLAARVLHAEPEIGPLPAPLDRLVPAALDKDPRRRPTAQSLLLTLIGGQAGDAAVQTSLNRTWSPPPVAAPVISAQTRTDPSAPTAPTVPTVPTVPTAPPGPPGPPPIGPVPLETRPSGRGGRSGRRGPLLAVGAAIAVVAAVSGGFALKTALGGSSGGPNDSYRAGGTGGTKAALTPPTDQMLVRLDRAPGFPENCHGSIAVLSPGSTAAPRRLRPNALSGDLGNQCDELPRWSPDRKLIAFTHVTGNDSALWVMNTDGTGARSVVSVKGKGRAAWSPDGRRLAYVDSVGKNRELFVIDLATSTPKRITYSPAVEDDPSWSHDGTRITFWSDKSGSRQVYALSVDDPSKPWTRVTSAPDHGAVDPEWSPDDRRIVYTRLGNSDDSDIWIVDADGSDDTRLTKDPAHEMDPGWSHDGKWVVFVRGPVPTPRVFAVPADGSADARPLTPVSPAIGHPNWSA